LENGLSLFSFSQELVQKQAVEEVLSSNETSARFGLVLTEQQALRLVSTRMQALKNTGRVEFGGGVIDKLIFAFCDSPYIGTQNYEQTLHELVDLFYYYKNELPGTFSDAELIELMKNAFNGPCAGSLELLAGLELDVTARRLRGGLPAEEENSDIDTGEGEDDDTES